ncbi:MAG: Asp-tRNA(Asn)/Glu-tRNA(Gln) amidotransferase subunit GatC [Candidatus Omnitrophota bacterium]
MKKDTIKYVAELARLKLKPEEEELFASQLNDILKYMDKLNKLDTKDVEPMSHAASLGNVFREDKVKDSLPNSEALKNAPSKEGKFFKVPKVIE